MKSLLCTPQHKQKNVCPDPALHYFAYCDLSPFAGGPHPSSPLALAAPRFGHWGCSAYLAALVSSKVVFGECRPTCWHLHSLHGEVKSIVNRLKIISTVSRRIYTTCFSPSKSDCSVKTCCSDSSSVRCFQTQQAGGGGSLKKKEKKKKKVLYRISFR